MIAPFLAALAATLLFTPAVRSVARWAGVIARPRSDRWNQRPTALLGGIAIAGGFAAGVGVAVVRSDTPLTSVVSRSILGIVLSAAAMFAVGLLDDRLKFRPATKLILQGVAGAILVGFGVVYPLTPWYSINVLVTLFWFFGLTNALNLLDNMDGVATGVAAIAALFLAGTFASESNLLLAAACLAVAGAALGFLPYNFYPASIFMGDSGSLFLGAILAGLGAAFPGRAPGSIVSVLFVPVFIVIIPILDTGLVTLTRTLAGRPISEGGRDHTTHRLVALGLSERQAALLLYAFSIAGGLVATALISSRSGFGPWIGGLFLLGLGILAAYLSHLHSYSPDEVRAKRPITVMINNLLYKRRALEVALDLVIFTVAYDGAYLLRYDGLVPAAQAYVLMKTLVVAVVAKSVAFGLMGVYRGTWQQMSLADVSRLFRASVFGSLLTITAIVFFFRGEQFARSILVVDGLLVLLLVVGSRVSFRWLDSLRRAFDGGEPALIYGAGKGGAVTVRELLANPELGLRGVGFIDDDRSKRGRLLYGLPVLGSLGELEGIVAEREVRHLIVATKKLTSDRFDRVVLDCQSLGLQMHQLHVELRAVAPIRIARPVASPQVQSNA